MNIEMMMNETYYQVADKVLELIEDDIEEMVLSELDPESLRLVMLGARYSFGMTVELFHEKGFSYEQLLSNHSN